MNKIAPANKGVLEFVIETRFGDPILCIDMAGSQLVYGTALGQIGYLNLSNKEQVLLTEMTEECVKGVYLNEESTLYATIGDLYVLVLYRNDKGEWHMEELNHQGREHSPMVCAMTHVFQSRPKICIVIIEEEGEVFENLRAEGKGKLIIHNLQTSEVHEYPDLMLPKLSAPMDFNGEKLLWIDKHQNGARELKILNISQQFHKKVKDLDKNFGHLSCAYLAQESIIYVHNYREIQSIDISTGESTSILGVHPADIVAIYPALIQTQHLSENDAEDHQMNVSPTKGLVVSADKRGLIYLWENGSIREMIDLCDLDGLIIESRERLFGMGYPYCLKASGIWISISTDVGILVVV